MILIIDNYDSFTFNIYHYLGEIGAKVNVYRNDKIDINEILELNPKAIVLSPGPCTPNEAGICLDLVKKLYSKYPILGICLGHQSIGQAFNGNIIQCSEIIHGKICKINHNNHKLFKNNLLDKKENVSFIKDSYLRYNRIDPNKKFDNFIIGSSNKLAFEASKKVSSPDNYFDY